MKNILVYVLLPIVIIVIAYFIYTGVMTPVNFEKQRTFREQKAIERLKDIRTLQVAFKAENGRFTGSFDTLLNFYKTGKVKIVKQVGSMDDSVAVAQKRVYRDTLRMNVRDTLLKRPGFIVDSLPFVPVVGGRFEMRARVAKVSGVEVPLFEACSPYNVVLRGLDKQLIINLNDEREKSNRYPGLKVGNVEQPNNNAGNWE